MCAAAWWSDAQEAEAVAARLVEAAHDTTIRDGDGDIVNVTLSIGIATLTDHCKFDSPKAFLAAADEALYHSKRRGRDQLTTFDSIEAA
ncbi:MAG: diguanylate cyclase [Gammaproteobacteria bacterium]|nr:MAG: diguanylate cyclase [Gammaproteobacteria bacterium]